MTFQKSITSPQFIIAITTLTSTYLFTKSLSAKYGGMQGLLRLIWEGDHLPPHIRESITKLENIEIKRIPLQKRKLDTIEITILTAKLNSVDNDVVVTHDNQNNHDDGQHQINISSDCNDNNEGPTNHQQGKRIQKHYILEQCPTLSKDISTLSYKLDQIAADIDSVQSYGDKDVKMRKKELSNRVVEMMHRVDEFIVDCTM